MYPFFDHFNENTPEIPRKIAGIELSEIPRKTAEMSNGRALRLIRR
jgi:hypothetical protein